MKTVRKLALVALVVALPAFAGTPSEGVPLEVRRGFFTETDIGGLVNWGGTPAYAGGNPGYSNFNPYLQLGVGYQLSFGKIAVPIGLHVGIGANASNCYGDVDNGGNCLQSDNFTLTFISLTAGVLYEVWERVYLGGKLLGGYTVIDPAATVDGGMNPITKAPHFGVAASVEWATNMDHFTVGFDVVFRLVVGPNIPSTQFFPRVKYTF
jgi:hypothetical protein